MTWHAIASERGQEYRLADRIRELGGPIAYVPTETHDRLVKREWVKHTKPALRGYVFVNCEDDELAKISALRGFGRWVASTLPDGSTKPATLSPTSLQAVFLAETFGALDYTKRQKPLRAGQRVRVTGGKWAGYLLRIVSVGRHKAMGEIEYSPHGQSLMRTLEEPLDRLEAA